MRIGFLFLKIAVLSLVTTGVHAAGLVCAPSDVTLPGACAAVSGHSFEAANWSGDLLLDYRCHGYNDLDHRRSSCPSEYTGWFRTLNGAAANTVLPDSVKNYVCNMEAMRRCGSSSQTLQQMRVQANPLCQNDIPQNLKSESRSWSAQELRTALNGCISHRVPHFRATNESSPQITINCQGMHTDVPGRLNRQALSSVFYNSFAAAQGLSNEAAYGDIAHLQSEGTASAYQYSFGLGSVQPWSASTPRPPQQSISYGDAVCSAEKEASQPLTVVPQFCRNQASHNMCEHIARERAGSGTAADPARVNLSDAASEAVVQNILNQFPRSCPANSEWLQRICQTPTESGLVPCCNEGSLPLQPAAYNQFLNVSRNSWRQQFNEQFKDFLVRQSWESYFNQLMLQMNPTRCAQLSSVERIKSKILSDLGMSQRAVNGCSNSLMGGSQAFMTAINNAAQAAHRVCTQNQGMQVPQHCAQGAEIAEVTRSHSRNVVNAALAIRNIDRSYECLLGAETLRHSSGNIQIQIPNISGGEARTVNVQFSPRLQYLLTTTAPNVMGDSETTTMPATFKISQCYPNYSGLECERYNPNRCRSLSGGNQCTASEQAFLQAIKELLDVRENVRRIYPAAANPLNSGNGAGVIQDRLSARQRSQLNAQNYCSRDSFQLGQAGSNADALLQNSEFMGDLSRAQDQARNEQLGLLRTMCEAGDRNPTPSSREQASLAGELAHKYPAIAAQFLRQNPENSNLALGACFNERGMAAQDARESSRALRLSLGMLGVGLGVMALGVVATPFAASLALVGGLGLTAVGETMSYQDVVRSGQNLEVVQGLAGACFLRGDNLNRAQANYNSAVSSAALGAALDVVGLGLDISAVARSSTAVSGRGVRLGDTFDEGSVARMNEEAASYRRGGGNGSGGGSGSRSGDGRITDVSETPTVVGSRAPSDVAETPTVVGSRTPTDVSDTPTPVAVRRTPVDVAEAPTPVGSRTPPTTTTETPTPNARIGGSSAAMERNIVANAPAMPSMTLRGAPGVEVPIHAESTRVNLPRYVARVEDARAVRQDWLQRQITERGLPYRIIERRSTGMFSTGFIVENTQTGERFMAKVSSPYGQRRSGTKGASAQLIAENIQRLRALTTPGFESYIKAVFARRGLSDVNFNMLQILEPELLDSGIIFQRMAHADDYANVVRARSDRLNEVRDALREVDEHLTATVRQSRDQELRTRFAAVGVDEQAVTQIIEAMNHGGASLDDFRNVAPGRLDVVAIAQEINDRYAVWLMPRTRSGQTALDLFQYHPDGHNSTIYLDQRGNINIDVYDQ